MRGGLYHRPTWPKGGRVASGKHNHPRLSEASPRSNLGRGDAFWNWRPGEIVVGPAKRRPVPFVNLPADGDA
jgi:hypothetical protein